ncbi:MAG TPA: hypothetical protein VFS00_28825, partial [Polyangiaceae bacterium]|nr:hypothetical protein [Polyangiaceae bacterium]
VVLTALRGASERDDDADDEDDDDAPEGPEAGAGAAGAALAEAPEGDGLADDEGADAWPTNSAPDVDDEGGLAPPHRRRKRARRALRRPREGTPPT